LRRDVDDGAVEVQEQGTRRLEDVHEGHGV
jgi:hypothetical protein